MREETVTVKIDHPLGSTDEDNPSVVYPINCGYVDVERTAGFSELDKQRVYLLGVDVAVDEYIGELIAVARRRDDPETVWIIAPENISYTIQQIEEMIYFEEQYYDSFVEIVDEELWDAYDENEKLLGFDLKRSQAKSLPDGVYHVIVNVYTMTKDGKLLTTERSRNKTYPLKWEVTGGSILKGETAADGGAAGSGALSGAGWLREWGGGFFPPGGGSIFRRDLGGQAPEDRPLPHRTGYCGHHLHP